MGLKMRGWWGTGILWLIGKCSTLNITLLYQRSLNRVAKKKHWYDERTNGDV